MSPEAERQRPDPKARSDMGSAPQNVLYFGLVVLMLLPLAWLVYRTSSGSSAQSPSTAQQQFSPSEEGEGQFRKYTDEGLGYYQNHDLSNAETAFRAALKHAPRSALGLNNLGAVYNERREYDAAIPFFKKALSIDPALEIARNNLAWAMAQTAKQGK